MLGSDSELNVGAKKKKKKYLLYRLHQGQGQTTSLITTVQVVSVTWVRKKAPISELMAGQIAFVVP